MRIRPSRPADCERLFEIWHAAVLATHDFLAEEDRAFFAGMVRDHYLPAASLWVAVDDEDGPIAFMELSDNNVDALFVAPEAHGKGIGRSMIDHARSLHPRLKVDVNEQNGGATAFYERMGFRRVGRSVRDDTGRPYPILHLAD